MKCGTSLASIDREREENKTSNESHDSSLNACHCYCLSWHISSTMIEVRLQATLEGYARDRCVMSTIIDEVYRLNNPND
jgi:hypothetical protein